jgi:hypothetical protein
VGSRSVDPAAASRAQRDRVVLSGDVMIRFELRPDVNDIASLAAALAGVGVAL